MTNGTSRAAFEFYIEAKETVIAAGYAWEIDWQEHLKLDSVTDSEFLREQAWVVLSSGMRATVVAQVFERISAAFFDWNLEHIRNNIEDCSPLALHAFNHHPKIKAIADNCKMLADLGLDSIKRELRTQGPTWLTRLHYIGPVTCWHLAKNLGVDVVKPDRHLVRMAHASGVMGATQLCDVFADASGDRVSVVDLVLWRYATLNPEYELKLRLLRFKSGARSGARAMSRAPLS